MEEESISSSQLEGAATTTSVAKEMLQTARKPRDEGERMILGNYRMMSAVWEHRDELLTPDLIRQFHRIGVEGIDDEKYFPGMFRENNNVSVVDPFGEVIHQPPSFDVLPQKIEELCQWANVRHEEDASLNYLHPLVKAGVLHFLIGYYHPFNDGNGRTARAVFYWYMLKCGYAAFRYISISRLLKKSPTAYAKAYLFTETDGFDLTYFVSYQCEIVSRAVKDFHAHIVDSVYQQRTLFETMWNSGLMKKLNQRQQILATIAIRNQGKVFSVKEVMENLSVSNNTARSDLRHLAALGLVRPLVEGKETFYQSPKTMKDVKKLIERH